jgi:hypothetical protein
MTSAALLVAGVSLVSGTTRHAPPGLAALSKSIGLAQAERTLPQTTDPPITQVLIGVDAAELNGQKDCGNVGADSSDIARERPCTFGDRSASRTLVVVGDSMAGAWVPTLDEWGRSARWRVVRLVKDGCPPWVTVIRYTPDACIAFNKFEVRVINALKPEAVFAVGLRYRGQLTMSTNPKGVATTIEEFANEIRPSKARVFVPQNTPWFFGLGSPLTCLAATPDSIARCNRDRRSKVVEPAMLLGIGAAARSGRITEVPVDQLFCSARTCPVLVGDTLLYADDHHFSRVWALHIWRAFGQVFDPLLGAGARSKSTQLPAS